MRGVDTNKKDTSMIIKVIAVTLLCVIEFFNLCFGVYRYMNSDKYDTAEGCAGAVLTLFWSGVRIALYAMAGCFSFS